MITEDYVSYEIAKLLNEKGFDEPCKSVYVDCGDYIDFYYSKEEQTDLQIGVWEVLRPTHQMAMKWLREKGVYIGIDTVISSSGNIYFNIDTYSKESGWNHPVDFYDSYEEAVEAALKYSLKKLI